MTVTLRQGSITLLIISATLISTAAFAADESLIRIHRQPGSDRGPLIDSGLTVIAETNDAWLAVGDPPLVAAVVSRFALATEIISDEVPRGSLALVGLRSTGTEADLAICGRVLDSGQDWNLLHSSQDFSSQCLSSTKLFLRVLDLEPLAAHRAPPEEWAGIADGSTRLVLNPLVQDMVDSIDENVALSHWAALSESPSWTTRHSSSQGCVDAASYVHGLFSSVGLQTEYQHHTSGHASNIIGTLPGSVEPEKIYIAIGHLDDLPSSGAAPGADDNASGTAMVTALAEVMSDYCFVSTVKFLAVTGEEQGLYGSDHYADLASAQGEDIQAVLNGDMIGWDGDGQPAEEDLDINYNAGSQWLAQAMVDAAADYQTGVAVNAFSCSSMTYSDHAPFWSNGFSAICGITDNEGFCGEGGSYPFYHQSSDTITNCGPDAPGFEAAAIRTYAATLAHLAQPIARVPTDPSGLGAQPDGDNRILLGWNPQSPGVAVKITRAAGGCGSPGPFIQVGESGITSFVDTTASGGVPYAYRIVNASADVCLSEVSACVETTTTGSCTEPPTFAGAATVINAATSSCRLTVGWQDPTQVWCGGEVTYNVYRSNVPGFEPSPATLVASGVSATSWVDQDVFSGRPYHYIVRAVDQANGNEDTNTHEVVGTPTGPFVIGTWTDDAGDAGAAKMDPSSPWSVSAGSGLTGAGYATGAYGDDTCAALTTPPMLLDTDPQLEFWSKYDIEDDWDKGELQISTDGGTIWDRVSMSYPGTSGHTNDECGLGTGSFFTGERTTYAPFTADLGGWAGQNVRLRWLFSSDGYINGDGWWIDDVSITDVAVPGSCSGADVIFVDDFESGDTTAWSSD